MLVSMKSMDKVAGSTVDRYAPPQGWLASLLVVVLFVLLTGMRAAAVETWQTVPVEAWQGRTKIKVEKVDGQHAAAIAHPAGQSERLAIDAGKLPAGLYEVRLTLRPSHVADVIAFHSGIRIHAADGQTREFPGSLFSRVHQPETRTFEVVHPQAGPLAFGIEAFADAGVVEKTRVSTNLKAGGPQMGSELQVTRPADDDETLDLDLFKDLAPERAVYYLVDEVAVRPVSHSGRIVKVNRNKIRYSPGATLRGSVIVADAGGHGGKGMVNIYIEHGVDDRVKVKSFPVTLAPEPQALAFDFPLPKIELGYAVVAEFDSADGADRHEASEYFTIASAFNRVYMGGSAGGGHGSTKADEATMRGWMESAMAGYINASEAFAWAEEDMVEMSPDTDYWFSGQTCYHMKKAGLQQMIRLSHEYGIARISYAKFIMSGYLGWKTAYDYPNDHRGQYHYPVGMWEGASVKTLDLFRNKEFLIYENTPGRIGANPFYVWWSAFLPINPDATPRMTRIAAEEVARSVEMFGWDGIRWDGHPRGGGQCGGPGNYDGLAARRTQSLMRYFKDIVAQKVPQFGHGYNYLMIQKEPGYDWAYEDFELDELCRGGGLIMNESIGNSTPGPFGYIARNLQVEGDLVRERGGFYLGISFASGPRDELVEGALWAAAGARPYNGLTVAMRRYMTRYAQYSLDENLRRLATPENVLKPLAETRLWWQPFVYETPLKGGKRQLVVNLLNLPLDAHRNPEGECKDFRMVPGTDPVSFALTLPGGVRATGVRLIDPQALEVTTVSLKDNRFDVPAVTHWLVAIVDLDVASDAPSLAALYGPPRTFGMPRPKRSEEPPPAMVLDTEKAVWEVNKDMSALGPPTARRTADEQTSLDSMAPAERQTRLLALRDGNPAKAFIDGWWKGGSLPADLKLKDSPPSFGALTPRRNGRFDIFHGRGPMDDRLRLPDVFARLDRFSVHDAPLAGNFRAGGGHYLVDGVDASRFSEFDLLLYTGIPHCAIGVENSYALVDYVKAGGAVLFTGGEYAFGKGGYMHTVLERELLPVLCTETVDTRYSQEPLPFEPGPAWGELGVTLDFSGKPSFWVWNQVALKDDPRVKIFLKSGNRPVLVGWQLGQGRVACLLIDHRGRSGDGATAFFDWRDWPALMQAVCHWLAPAAAQVDASPPARAGTEVAKLIESLKGDAMDDMLAGLQDETKEPGLLGPAGAPGGEASSARELSADSLRKRVAVLERALADAPTRELGKAFAGQLASIGNLPQALRWQLIDAVQKTLPQDLGDVITPALASSDPAIRQNACQLAGAAGIPAFAAEVQRAAPVTETDAIGRQRALALGLALYSKDDLVKLGSTRVSEWNAVEKQRRDAYTGGKSFSLAAPEGPFLDKEILFQRVAWLAYLSRYEGPAYGAQFAGEWLKISEYQEYCDRTVGNLWGNKEMSESAKRNRAEDIQHLRACLTRLSQLTRPDLERLIAKHPDLVAEGFRQAHFTAEFRAAMNVLGALEPAASAAVASLLKNAKNPNLAAFAEVRSKPTLDAKKPP